MNFEDRDWIWLTKKRRFSPEEDTRLRQLRNEHHGYASGKQPRDGSSAGGLRTVAGKLCRTPSSVQMRLIKLAHDDEAADRL